MDYGAGLTEENLKMKSGFVMEPRCVRLLSLKQSFSLLANVPLNIMVCFRPSLIAASCRGVPGSISVSSPISESALFHVFALAILLIDT